MRTRIILALSAISATVTALACSSGGTGSPTFFDPALSGGGGSNPALGPLPKPVTGDDDQTPTVDSGSGGTDTGVKDTGSGGTDTGTNDICNAPSPCAADPTPTASEIANCRNLINGTTCPSQYKALLTCYRTKAVCDASDKTDTTATAANCTTEQNALNTCTGGG